MKILEAETGKSMTITGPRVFKISMIINEVTIAQLAKAVPRTSPPSAALDSAVMNTHSVEYANNAVIQTGGRIASARVQGGRMQTAQEALISPEVMTEYGLSPTDQVLSGFNVFLDVVPANAPNPPPSPPPNAPTPVVPVPVPVPGDRDAGGE